MGRRKKNKKITVPQKPYYKNNPTISVRVPIDVKENRLPAVLKVLNMSKKDFFMAMVGDFEIGVQQIEDAEGIAFEAGYKEGHTEGVKESYTIGFKNGRIKGFEEGKKLYAVTYKCVECGENIAIETPEEKISAGELMTEGGWAHKECADIASPKEEQRK